MDPISEWREALSRTTANIQILRIVGTEVPEGLLVLRHFVFQKIVEYDVNQAISSGLANSSAAD